MGFKFSKGELTLQYVYCCIAVGNLYEFFLKKSLVKT